MICARLTDQHGWADRLGDGSLYPGLALPKTRKLS
jgi:hypothetical protein